jgi:type II secretion system protein N
LPLLGYAGFALLCLLIFAVLFFPYRSLELRLEQELAKSTGLNVAIDELQYGFPFGLAFDSLALTPRQAATPVSIRITEGRLSLNPLSLAANRLKAELHGHVLDGTLRLVTRSRAVGPHLPARLETDWDAVDLSQLDRVWDRIPEINAVQGRSSGHSSLTVDGRQLSALDGAGEIELSQAAAELTLPGVDAVNLKNVAGKANWKLEQGELRINRCDLQGRGVQGELHGTVGLSPRLHRSRLDLEGRLSVTQAQPQLFSLMRRNFKSQSMEFALKGQAGAPIFEVK